MKIEGKKTPKNEGRKFNYTTWQSARAILLADYKHLNSDSRIILQDAEGLLRSRLLPGVTVTSVYL